MLVLLGDVSRVTKVTTSKQYQLYLVDNYDSDGKLCLWWSPSLLPCFIFLVLFLPRIKSMYVAWSAFFFFLNYLTFCSFTCFFDVTIISIFHISKGLTRSYFFGVCTFRNKKIVLLCAWEYTLSHIRYIYDMWDCIM